MVGHASGVKDLAQRALDLAADDVAMVVHRDGRVVQMVEIADDIGPLKRPAVLLHPALQFLPKDERQERAE